MYLCLKKKDMTEKEKEEIAKVLDKLGELILRANS
jgi:hypothetical protein